MIKLTYTFICTDSNSWSMSYRDGNIRPPPELKMLHSEPSDLLHFAGRLSGLQLHLPLEFPASSNAALAEIEWKAKQVADSPLIRIAPGTKAGSLRVKELLALKFDEVIELEKAAFPISGELRRGIRRFSRNTDGAHFLFYDLWIKDRVVHAKSADLTRLVPETVMHSDGIVELLQPFRLLEAINKAGRFFSPDKLRSPLWALKAHTLASEYNCKELAALGYKVEDSVSRCFNDEFLAAHSERRAFISGRALRAVKELHSRIHPPGSDNEYPLFRNS